jgi:glycerophosphoryl diester phosphodiesterase
VHGHLGCRGLMPENTLPAFLKAAELGVDWLELDVVVTADSQVLVSHEPWMSARICAMPDGSPVDSTRERELNIYRMTLAEAQAFDCGSTEHPRFPDQALQRARKPTLRELVEAVDEQVLATGLAAPGFNIEIKSDPALYGTFQPRPVELARLVMLAIDSLGIRERCMVQSFDPAVLQHVHDSHPDAPIALLVENSDGLIANLQRLSFTPAAYSPRFDLVDAALVAELHRRGIAVVAWTVNSEADIRRMMALGVDGIISDYPDRAIRLVGESD